MQRSRIAILFALLFFNGAFCLRDQSLQPYPWQKGITYANVMDSEHCYGSPQSRASLEYLKDLGVEWVALIPYGFQPSPREGVIYTWMPQPYCVRDDCLEEAIHNARELGLKILLKPHLWVGEQGSVTDIKLSERAWEQWFGSYREFILHYASLAERLGAQILSVGVELEQATKLHPERWRQLIAEVRRLYDGQLVYAANWDGEVQRISFWDALDFIGVDLYQPLSDHSQATSQELKNRAARVGEELERLSKVHGKRVILTEVGFKSTRDCAMRPWAWEVEQPPDPEQQARCYEAIFRAFHDRPWLAGIYWWLWSSDPDAGGASDFGFTPRRKPAEEVLRTWYKRPIE